MRILDFSDGFESPVAPDSVPVDATQVSVTPDGNLSSTDAQAAFEELQGDIDAINTSKGANNGIATLDSGGKVPSTQLPAIAITEVYVVADITARDALTVDEGDIAKVTDAGGGTTKTYIYDGSSWIEIQADGQLATHEADTSTHGVAGDIVGTSDAQVLMNKDFDGGTASNTSRLTVPKNTKSNLDSLTRKEATIVYATDEAKAYIDNGSTLIPVGSGSGGGLNYIENGDAELASPAPSLYADSGTRPVDGTGGSVNTSTELDFSRSTSSPLRGSASWVFDKKSGNQQGKGGAFPFTIDVADKGKQASITFDYSVLSGTYATGDVAVYIVHDPSGTPKVIQPSAFNIENVGVESLARLTFQTEYSSVLDYRLCFHVASTSSSAYSLKFDNIVLGPQVVPMGAPVTDWVAYTPSVSALSGSLTNYTVTGFWKRNGDTASYKFRILFTGSPGTWSTPQLGLPSGHVIDVNKIPGGSISNYRPFQSSRLADASVGSYVGLSAAYTTTSVIVQYESAGQAVAVTQVAPFAFVSGDWIDVELSEVPIAGWSSSTVVSSSADTRVVAARVINGAMTSIGAANVFPFSTVVFDTHSGMGVPSAGRYTVRVPGFYRVSCAIQHSSGLPAIFVYKNSSIHSAITAVLNGGIATGTGTFQFNAGDIVDLRPDTTTTTGTVNFFEIERLQGPSQIAASEVVAGRFGVSSNQTGVNPNNSSVKMEIKTSSIDTHGMLDAANNRLIIPAPGLYSVSARRYVAGTNVLNNLYRLQIYRNGVQYGDGVWTYPPASAQFCVTTEDLIQCNAGDVIELYFNGIGNNSVNTLTATTLILNVKRLGGV